MAAKAAGQAVLYTDGAARGNPGPAGAGAFLVDEDGQELGSFKLFLGETTNNVAEYKGLILGLTKALELGVRRVEARLDSELLVKQLNGLYKVKSPHLKPLYVKARDLLQRFDSRTIIHVRREFNKEADRLANLAIDQA